MCVHVLGASVTQMSSDRTLLGGPSQEPRVWPCVLSCSCLETHPDTAEVQTQPLTIMYGLFIASLSGPPVQHAVRSAVAH